MGAKYSKIHPSANLPESHPFYWAEELIGEMDTPAHQNEHALMGGNLDRHDRVLHLAHHIKFKLNNNLLTKEQKELWEKAEVDKWVLSE